MFRAPSHAVPAVRGEGTRQHVVARQDRAGHSFAWQAPAEFRDLTLSSSFQVFN